MYNEIKEYTDKGEKSPYWAKLEDFVIHEDGTIELTSITGKSSYEEIKDGELYNKPYCDKYKRGKHFKLVKAPTIYNGHKCNYTIPIRTKKGIKFNPPWDISVKLPYYVDEKYMSWSAHSDAKYPIGTWDFCTEHVLSYDGWACSAAYCKSIRALTRRITKWNLPIGTIVKVTGRYVGEKYAFIIKK